MTVYIITILMIMLLYPLIGKRRCIIEGSVTKMLDHNKWRDLYV